MAAANYLQGGVGAGRRGEDGVEIEGRGVGGRTRGGQRLWGGRERLSTERKEEAWWGGLEEGEDWGKG